jgi:hypothetical protein
MQYTGMTAMDADKQLLHYILLTRGQQFQKFEFMGLAFF